MKENLLVQLHQQLLITWYHMLEIVVLQLPCSIKMAITYLEFIVSMNPLQNHSKGSD
jgi:hypothetical protein